MHETDVVVVGGGPAGLAAAVALRRKGFSATVVDTRRPPVDKPCGEGLLPDAVEAASRIGLALPWDLGFRFRGMRFTAGPSSVEANFSDGAGLGVRRTVLHSALADQAVRAGVSFVWGLSVSGCDGASVTAGNRKINARWIVGADGRSSSVRRWAGLGQVRGDRRRFGFRRHYSIPPWTPCMEIHWGEGCQIYVTPVAAQEICVVVMSGDPRLRLEQALDRFPVLAQRLAAARTVSEERGAISSTCRLRSVTRGRVALIGDASGSADAITGQGIGLAFRQAVALADAIEAGDLSRYEAEHRRLSRRPAFMANLMLTLESRPRLRARVMRVLASKPTLFADLLATHVGRLSPLGVARTGLALGWQLVSAGASPG